MAKTPKSISLRSLRACSIDPKWLYERLRSDLHQGDFRNRYLLDSVLSKYAEPSPASKELRHRRALAKLLWTDRENGRTVKRLETNPEILPGVSAASIKLLVAREVSRILGPFTFDAFASASFSSGASTSRRRTEAGVAEKFDGIGDVTTQALPYFVAASNLDPVWRRNLTIAMLENDRTTSYNLVPGNVCFTVPKKDDIDRAACKEPDFNMYLQKGCGDFIRSRLRRDGIDLNDQSVNQRLARQGSIDGSLATLDLSAASDSITWKLVMELLPFDWFNHLDNIRSKRTFINGKWRTMNLFSTMGNGFTFELESLLFYSMCIVATRLSGISHPTIGVYGDDLIVPTQSAEYLILILNYFGFRTNVDKSFVEGPFRESCGGHYYNGRDVTPFYVREPINDVTRVIWLLNKIREWSSEGTDFCLQLEDLWYEIYHKFPILHLVTGYARIDSILSVAHPVIREGRLKNQSRSKHNPSNGALCAQLRSNPSALIFNYHCGKIRASVRDGASYSRKSFPTGKWFITKPSSIEDAYCSTLQYGDIPSFSRELSSR